MRTFPTLLIPLFFMLSCSQAVLPPESYGPVPTPEQLEWQKMEYYMFVHFGPNTFTDMEWGHGNESPDVFNPSDMDCRQWAATAKAAGMKGIILTAKHHDGFCLWPSQYSTHTVRESKWRDGNGDVLQELSEACREYDLKFGIYVSPWDRNHPLYGTDEYNEVFAGTLREVLTGYGKIFEQWLDGANGEGASGKKQKYDWELFHSVIYECQPDIVIFSDVGPGCRWIGNEKGVAGTTNWSKLDSEGFVPGHGAPSSDTLNRGNIYGSEWIPGEADVSIRPGWFYSPSTDDKVKSTAELLDIYFTSVGRNANLLLNVPPDRTGKINPIDSARLMDFRDHLDRMFSANIATGSVVTADNTRGKDKKYTASNILSPDYDMYWAADDGVTSAVLEIKLPQKKVFNMLMLQEYIPLGQRISSWSADYFDASSGNWRPLAEGTTIGYKRMVRFGDVTTDRVRVVIENSFACPLINGFGLFFDEFLIRERDSYDFT